MKRVLLTGGTGFVGANLARRLIEDGHEVHLFVRQSHDPWRISSIVDDLRMHVVNLGDLQALESAVSEAKPEWIFHLAAHGAYSGQKDEQEMLRTNLLGTINLVESCAKYGFEAFVNTGSSSEYGFVDHPPQETELPEPNSDYAFTKSCATTYCRYAAKTKNLRIATLRLYSAFGPYEDPGRFIPALILKGLDGKLPDLVNPDIARDFVYIKDVEDACLLAAERPMHEAGAIFNVGTGVQISIREAVDVARSQLGIGAEPNWGTMSDRSWDTTTWVADSRKIREQLGWQPKFNFEHGFKKTIEWFRENPGMMDSYRTRERKGMS